MLLALPILVEGIAGRSLARCLARVGCAPDRAPHMFLFCFGSVSASRTKLFPSTSRTYGTRMHPCGPMGRWQLHLQFGPTLMDRLFPKP